LLKGTVLLDNTLCFSWSIYRWRRGLNLPSVPQRVRLRLPASRPPMRLLKRVRCIRCLRRL